MAESFRVGTLTITIQPTPSAVEVTIADAHGLRGRVSLFETPGAGVGIVVRNEEDLVANLRLTRGPAVEPLGD